MTKHGTTRQTHNPPPSVTPFQKQEQYHTTFIHSLLLLPIIYFCTTTTAMALTIVETITPS